MRKWLRGLWIAVLLSIFISCGVRNSNKTTNQVNDTEQSQVHSKDSTKTAVTLIDAGDSSETITYFLDSSRAGRDTIKGNMGSSLATNLIRDSYKIQVRHSHLYSHTKEKDSSATKTRDTTDKKTKIVIKTNAVVSQDNTPGTAATYWFTKLSTKSKLCISAFVTALLLLVYLGKKFI